MKRYLVVSFAFALLANKSIYSYETVCETWCRNVYEQTNQEEQDAIKALMAEMHEVIMQYETMENTLNAVTQKSGKLTNPQQLLGVVWNESRLPAFLKNVWESVSGNAWHLIEKLRSLIFGSNHDEELLTQAEQSLPEATKWLIKLEKCRVMLAECEEMLRTCQEEVAEECC